MAIRNKFLCATALALLMALARPHDAFAACTTGAGADTCDIDSLTDQNDPIDALGGIDILNLTGAANFSFNMNAINTVFTNFEVLQKTGTSTVVLDGAAGLNQGIDIREGTISANTGVLGAKGLVSLAAAGTLRLTGDLSIGALEGAGGTVNLQSSLLTIGGAGVTATFAGGFIGTGGIEIVDGTTILDGFSSHESGAILSGGTLRLENNDAVGGGILTGNGGALDLALGLNLSNDVDLIAAGTQIGVAAGSAELSGIIGDGGAGIGFTKTGGGNLRLSGANTFTGLTTVSAGQLTIAGAGEMLADVEMQGGAFFTFATAGDYTYNGVVSGSGRFSASANIVTLTAAQAFTNSIVSVNNSATLLLTVNNTFGALAGNTNRIDISSGGTLDLGGTTQAIQRVDLISTDDQVVGGTLIVQNFVGINRGLIGANIQGAPTVRKEFAGSAYLSGNNTYTGSTEVNNGTLIVQGGSAIGDTSDVTILAPGTLQLDASETIGALSGAGTVDLQGFDLTTGRNSYNSTFAGLIEGTGRLIKANSGQLTLTGANTYLGGTTISGGTLRVEHNNALGTGSLTTTGSVLDYADGINLATPIVVDSMTTRLQVLTGSATQSGAISETGGARPLEKIGAGTLTLTAANTYSGGTTVSAGTLRFTGTGTAGASGSDLAIASGATVDLTNTTQTVDVLTLTGNASVIGESFGVFPLGTLVANTINATTGAGTTAKIETNRFTANTINKNGAGTLSLDAPSNFGFTGVVELNAGVLELGWQGVLDTGTVKAYDNTQISYFRGGQNHYNQIALHADTVKLTPNPGVNIVQHGVISEIGGSRDLEIVTDTVFALTANNTYTGVTTVSGGGTLYLGYNGTTGSVAGDIALTGGSLGILRTDTALNLAGVISGAGGIFTDGVYDFGTNTINAGKWTLSGNNTFSGGVNVNAGTLRAGSSTAFGTGFLNANNNPLNAPDSISTFSLNGFDIAAAGLNGNGVFDLGGNTLTVLGAGGFLGGASVTAGNLTVEDGANQGFDSVDLSQIGTLLVNGRVDISGSGNVAPQTITLNASGHLDFEFMSDAEYVAANIGGAGTIFLNDRRLALGTGDIDVTLASEISGTGGSLRKTGAGTLTLSGANTFDGGIALEQGTLRLAVSGAAGTGPIETTGSVVSYANGVNNIAPIVINSATTQLEVLTGHNATQSGVISELGGPRPLEKIGGGFLGLSAANTYTGLTTITDGRLQLIGSGTVSNTVNIVGSNAWLDFARTDTYTYGGVISGGQAAQIGTGTTVLTGTNTHTYWGISDGTLRVGTGGKLAADTATFGISGVSGLATLDLGGSAQTVSMFRIFDGFQNAITNGDLTVTSQMFAEAGTISANLHGAGTLIKNSAGTTILSGTNTYTGQTTINGGTLVLQGGSAIADTNAVTINGGTLQLDANETIGSLAGAGAVVLNGATLTTGGNGATTTFSGLIAEGFPSGGGLVKGGSGSLLFEGLGTFSGGTTINAGSIVLSGLSGTIGGDIAVANGATLEFNRSSPLIFTDVISGAGTVKQNNPSGAIILTGANTLTGAMIVTNGALIVSGAGTFGDGASVTLSASGSGATVDLGGTSKSVFRLGVDQGATVTGAPGSELSVADSIDVGNGSITVDLSGAAGLNKITGIGGNTVTLSGNNTYTGDTFAQNGTIIASGGNAIPDDSFYDGFASATLTLLSDETINEFELGGGTLNLGSNTFTFGNNNDRPWGGTVSGDSSSSLIKQGSSRYTFLDDLGHLGSTVINSGEINFNGTAVGSIVVNSGGKLSGTHTINGDLTNLGTLASGNSPGTTTVLGNYTGGGTLDVEVQFDNAGSPINGTTHDFLNIAGDVLGSPTTVNLLTFAPSGLPAATTGNGIEIVRVGGGTSAADFTMTSYLLGDYYYDLTYLQDYTGSTDGFFLQSTLAVPGCVVDGLDNACFIDDAANTIGAAVNALGGNDTLQLTGTTDFTFDVSRIGTTYTNFEVFQKADTNTVTLSGVAASSTQGIDIQNGTLIASTGTLGAQGRVNVFTPGILQVASNLTIGSLAGSGNAALGSNTLATGGDNSSTLFSGVISGSGVLQKDGSGTLTLSGVNTHTGQTSLQSGGITISGAGTLGAATVGLFVQGTLDLGGTSQTVGDLGMSAGSIQNGALTVNGNAFAQVGTISADLTVTGNFSKAFGGGSLTLSGNNTLSSVSIGSGTLIAANDAAITDTAAVNLSYIGFGLDPRFNILTNQTVGSIASDVFGAINLGANTLTVGGNGASTTFAGGIFGAGGKLVKTGAGMLTLSGNNPFTGGIDLMQGGIRLASNTAAGSGPITTFGSVIDYASGVNIFAPVVINSATTQFQVTSGAATQSGNISQLGGARPFEKIGAGELILAGTNTFTGATTISAGTLTVQGGSAISDLSAVSVASGATFNLAGSETVGSLTGSGIVALGANTLTAGGTGASTTFAGAFTGTGAFAKAGIGTLSLSGSTAAASVDMLVQGGRLIAGAGTLGAASANTVASGATFEITGNNTVTSITGLGAVEVNGANLVANQVLVNEFTLNGGMVSGGILGANTVDVLAGTVASQLLIGNTNQITIAAAASVSRPTGPAIVWLQDATGAGIVFDNDGAVESFGGAHALTANAPRNGPLTLDNSGSFTANGGGNAIDLANASGSITITNSGTISGAAAIVTGAGNDVLNLTTSSVIAGRINLGGGANTLNLSGPGAGTVFGENSSGAPSVTDWVGVDNLNVNSGTWTLLGGGYYDNVFIASGATLIADDTGFGGAADGGLGEGQSGALQLTVNGTFRYNNTQPTFLYGGNPASTIVGNGLIDLTTGGGLVLAGANTFTGQLLIDGGTRIIVTGAMPGDFNIGATGQLIIGATLVPAGVDGSGTPVFDVGGAGATGDVSGNINVAATGLLKFNRSNNSTYGGQLSGSGKLIKDGAGMLTLSGNNSGLLGGIDILHGGIFLANNNAAGTGPITTFGSVISYANATNIATPIVIASNTTQVEQIGGSAIQSGPIGETGGSRPLEKIGNGNLTFSGTNTFTGPMTVSAGTLTLQGGAALADGVAVNVAAPGTLALNTSETVGSLAGAGALNMSAGTALTAGGNNASTLFSGNMTGGGFTKAGTGTFTFTGSGALGGPLDVNAGVFIKTGGPLSGASAFNTVSGATSRLGAAAAGVNGAGIAATGMGAIAVAGGGTLYLDDNTSVTGSSLTLATGSNLGVFLTTNTAVHPQIAVTGVANVAGNLGVYLDPLSFGATVATTFTYDNVVVGASRSGTFGAVNLLQTPNSLFSVAAIYGANDVDLTVTRSSFASLGGGGGNDPEVGGAIEDIFVIGTTDPDLTNLIGTLASAPPGTIAAIYAAISGSTSAEAEGAGLRTDDPWKQSVAERVNAARTPGCVVAGDDWCFRRYAQAQGLSVTDVLGDRSAFEWLDTGIRDNGTTSVWSRAIGIWSELDGSSFAPGSRQWSGGLIGGIDRVFDSLLLAGVAAQYIETHVNFDKSDNASVMKTGQLGAYVSYGGAEAFVNGNVSVIGSQGKSERFMAVGPLSYAIESFMRGWTGTASVEAGTILETDGFRFEPTLAFNYNYASTDEYREKGGGGLGLLIDPDDSESLRSALTARLSRVFDLGDRKIVPQLRADWRHEFLDRGQSFQAAFAGAPSVLFNVEGTQYARDTFGLGASVTVPITGRTTGYVDAQGALSEDSVSTMLTLGVRATW